MLNKINHEFGLNARGQVHVCLPFYLQMHTCIDRAQLPSDCMLEV
jgi:hypothetical protein